MSRNIYLVGFMASGKTTLGKQLAQALKRKFVDMDQVLEAQFRKPIREVFASPGEEAFRHAESSLLKKLARQDRLVVATGGGVPERGENRHLMRSSGQIVHLDASLSSSMERLNEVDKATRPLWKDEQSVKKLFDQRRSLYQQCDVTVDVDRRSLDESARAIVDAFVDEQRFTVRMGETSCPVISTYFAAEVLPGLVGDRRTAVLTDRTVARLHLDRFRAAMGPSLEIVIPAGERSKSLSSAQLVFERLIEHRFDRDDLLVALGGGVITDLGAYVASTYKRGMDFALVSTTLVGCVDAAVGGKTAINLGQAKNVIGTFSVPTAVVLDVASLTTLGRNRLSEGLVEAYKTGLVASHELAELIDVESGTLMAGDVPMLAQVVARSARTKGHVVSGDFREHGLRRILNFGHTFGHAVEGWHGFKISHAQAVALGMRVATQISRVRGLITDKLVERIFSTLQRISPRQVVTPPIDEAWEIMKHDKKIRGGRLVFVLLEGVGQPVCVENVSKEEVAGALRSIEERHGG
jgi:shikimate kinase / 3-dehydroquinate synthase